MRLSSNFKYLHCKPSLILNLFRGIAKENLDKTKHKIDTYKAEVELDENVRLYVILPKIPLSASVA